MLTAKEEVERLLAQIRLVAPSQTVSRATDQISVLCGAYMEPSNPTAGQGLGLSKSQARMFDLLLARKGKIVRRESLLDVSIHQDKEPDIKIIDVQICLVRKNLKGTRYEGKIETVWGIGYRLAA